MRSALLLSVSAIALLAAACGSSPHPEPASAGGPTPPAASTPTAPAPIVAPVVPEAPAHKLVVAANACWFGGVWADAERDVPEARRGVIEARCREVLKAVYGNDDKVRLEQLRAYEATVVGDLAAKVETFAAQDPREAAHKEVYAKLVTMTAAAQREAMEARRAADRVKRDLDHEPEKLTSDEVAAVAPLQTTKELDALLAFDAGDLSADAHAIGLVTAMDRIALSRGLPKHLKVYALSGTFKTLFGTNPPDMPTDATKSLKKGNYLAYLTEAAKAAGHPVADIAKTPREKEGLAWSGALHGVADKIKANTQKLSADTDLHEVSLRIANRLTAWHEAEQKAVAAVETKDPKAKPTDAKKPAAKPK